MCGCVLAFVSGRCEKYSSVYIPFLQLVKIASSVNSSQQSGSGSICLDITGGSIAVAALGSTGCSIVCSSSPSREMVEFDLSRLEVVFCVSDLRRGLANREDMLPRFLTEEALGRCSIPTLKSHNRSRRSSPTLPNR